MSEQDQRSEIVFGLVGAVGSDLDFVVRSLTDALAAVKYTAKTIRLSGLLQEALPGLKLPKQPEEDRLTAYMDAGNALREQLQRGDALALLAIGRITEMRRATQRGERPSPIPACAYVLQSLKHDAEVDRLRRTYGPGFFLIGAFAADDNRLESLAKRIAQSHSSEEDGNFRELAHGLMQRDQFEPANQLGQRVRETFCKSDVFIDLSDRETAKESIRRFVEILFFHPNHTPTRAEHAMYLAHAAAVTSSSLARQVGAVITSADGDVISMGANEVPRPQGGLYRAEDGEQDGRDFKVGYDSNTRMKAEAVQEILATLTREEWLTPDRRADDPKELLKKAQLLLKDTRVMNLTEFGREVHAEMAALMDATKRGVAVRGGALFCTTFPCHNCAKHIVAAGIREVYYIEPYPKSVAAELYPDSICVGTEAADAGGHHPHRLQKIPFRAFVGVGARRYMDLFAMITSEGWHLDRKDHAGNATAWKPDQARPRLPMWDRSYLEREQLLLDSIQERMMALAAKKEET